MATLVQFASNEADPAVPSLASVPTSGNLLVAAAMERSGNSETLFTITGTGWTKRIARDTELAETTFRRSFVVWTKIAGASEPQSVTIDNGTTSVKLASLAEYSLGAGEDEWTYLDGATNDNAQTANATSLATGTTGSVTGDKKFLIAVLLARREAITAAWTCAWATETLTADFSVGATSNGRHISSGSANSDADGTKASTGTISGTSTLNAGLSAGIIVFRTKAAGADEQIPMRRIFPTPLYS